MISTPWRNLKAWSSMEDPPTTTHVFMSMNCAHRATSAQICVASSRVGARTKANGPSSAKEAMRSFGSLEMYCSIGIAKAQVLPDPVSATPIMSRSSRPTGMAARWIGDGSLKPITSMACRISAAKPASAQLRSGIGARPPRTRMSKSSFMMRQSRSSMSSKDLSVQCSKRFPNARASTPCVCSAIFACSSSRSSLRRASRSLRSFFARPSASSAARSSPMRFSDNTSAKVCARRCSRMSRPAT
mmetsp:Transcript_32020/g.107806  ORF Transcript_32020/g.107806 Transcript_32020/m.107806 type:complete len:244 (+) Transcript_32020:1238-1969(+)